MSSGPRRRPTDGPRPADPRVLGIIAGIIVVILGVIIANVVFSGDDTSEVGVDGDGLTATPITTATEGTAVPSTPAPDPTPTPTPSPGATATATAVPDPDPTEQGPREPTDADASDFAAALLEGDEGDGEFVLADLDTDGRNEVVVATRLGGRSRVDIATWDGSAYRLWFSGEGASADALAGVEVRDINGVPETPEVVVRQTSGEQGESITVWGMRDGQMVPYTAVDGCWDGSNTYGIIGASIADTRITATCDGSPLPTAAWPSDIYVWDIELEAFAYERTVE